MIAEFGSFQISTQGCQYCISLSCIFLMKKYGVHLAYAIKPYPNLLIFNLSSTQILWRNS